MLKHRIQRKGEDVRLRERNALSSKFKQKLQKLEGSMKYNIVEEGWQGMLGEICFSC